MENKEEIKKQAKKIIENFSKKLSKIDIDIKETPTKQEIERNENETIKEDFSRDIMFRNAKEKDKKFIISEKKKW